MLYSLLDLFCAYHARTHIAWLSKTIPHHYSTQLSLSHHSHTHSSGIGFSWHCQTITLLFFVWYMPLSRIDSLQTSIICSNSPFIVPYSNPEVTLHSFDLFAITENCNFLAVHSLAVLTPLYTACAITFVRISYLPASVSFPSSCTTPSYPNTYPSHVRVDRWKGKGTFILPPLIALSCNPGSICTSALYMKRMLVVDTISSPCQLSTTHLILALDGYSMAIFTYPGSSL